MYYIFGVIFFFKTFITSLQIRVIFIIRIIKGYIISLIKYEEQCRISTKSIKSEVYITAFDGDFHLTFNKLVILMAAC